MSLNADYRRVQGYETVCFDASGHLRRETNLLVFTALMVDLSEIAEKNLSEWRFRLAVLKRTGMEAGPISDEVLQKHVGLRVNVAERPRKQWIRRIAEILERETENAIRRAAREAQEVANAS